MGRRPATRLPFAACPCRTGRQRLRHPHCADRGIYRRNSGRYTQRIPRGRHRPHPGTERLPHRCNRAVGQPGAVAAADMDAAAEFPSAARRGARLGLYCHCGLPAFGLARHDNAHGIHSVACGGPLGQFIQQSLRFAAHNPGRMSVQHVFGLVATVGQRRTRAAVFLGTRCGPPFRSSRRLWPRCWAQCASRYSIFTACRCFSFSPT